MSSPKVQGVTKFPQILRKTLQGNEKGYDAKINTIRKCLFRVGNFSATICKKKIHIEKSTEYRNHT